MNYKDYLRSSDNGTHIGRFTYRQFVDFSEKRIKAQEAQHESSRRKESGSNPWSGANNFEQALKLGRSGWDAGIRQLDLENGVMSDVGVEFSPNVTGAVVNMQNYLQGVPDNMFELKTRREYTLPEVTLYVPLQYSAGNSAKKAMNFTKKIVEYTNELQSKHNVRIIGFFAANFYGDVKRSVTEVVIKDYDERFVLNNVAFAFHPAFFRRLWFAHHESMPHWSSGYGMPCNHKQCVSHAKKTHDGRGGSVILPSLGDLTTDCHAFRKQVKTLKEIK